MINSSNIKLSKYLYSTPIKVTMFLNGAERISQEVSQEDNVLAHGL